MNNASSFSRLVAVGPSIDGAPADHYFHRRGVAVSPPSATVAAKGGAGKRRVAEGPGAVGRKQDPKGRPKPFPPPPPRRRHPNHRLPDATACRRVAIAATGDGNASTTTTATHCGLWKAAAAAAAPAVSGAVAVGGSPWSPPSPPFLPSHSSREKAPIQGCTRQARRRCLRQRGADPAGLWAASGAAGVAPTHPPQRLQPAPPRALAAAGARRLLRCFPPKGGRGRRHRGKVSPL